MFKITGSPTVGGMTGYLLAGIIKITNHIILDNIIAFLRLFEPGRVFLPKANTIPNKDQNAIPNIVPAATFPLFCQKR